MWVWVWWGLGIYWAPRGISTWGREGQTAVVRAEDEDVRSGGPRVRGRKMVVDTVVAGIDRWEKGMMAMGSAAGRAE